MTPDVATLVPLGAVADLEMGQSPPSTFVTETPGAGLPFLQGNADFTHEHPRPRLWCRRPQKTCRPADVLISVRAPVGAINVADQTYCIGRGLAAVRFSEADSRFGYHALRFFAPALARVAQGTTFDAIGRSELANLQVRLPSPEERSRITDVLDTADKAIRGTEELLAKLGHLKLGLLHDLLTRGLDGKGQLRDPSRCPEVFTDTEVGRVPSRWEVAPLSSAADIVDPNPSHRYPAPSQDGVPLVCTENFVGENDFDLTKASRVPLTVLCDQNSRCQFRPGDVVFARKGRIGFARPYGHDPKVFSHTVVLMKPRPHRYTDRFLLWVVRAAPFFAGIRARMNSNVGVPTLGVDFLGKVPVPIPPPGEQAKIAAILDQVQARIELEDLMLGKLRRLKQGLAAGCGSSEGTLEDELT